MKRLFDLIISLVGLLCAMPVLLPVIFLVWYQDRYSPFYIANRTGLNEKQFKMVKLRSMIKNADKTGVDSTSANDSRITPVGHFIRRFKLDEITQLWNVLIGDMSLVGPRPNVKRETDLYTTVEKELLTVKPGITDFSSIVFSDEGDILKDQLDPDIAYHQLIRPGKSLLGLYYLEKKSFWVDLQLIFLTIYAIFSKKSALEKLVKLMRKLGSTDQILKIAARQDSLVPTPPPGADKIVTSRDGSL